MADQEEASTKSSTSHNSNGVQLGAEDFHQEISLSDPTPGTSEEWAKYTGFGQAKDVQVGFTWSKEAENPQHGEPEFVFRQPDTQISKGFQRADILKNASRSIPTTEWSYMTTAEMALSAPMPHTDKQWEGLANRLEASMLPHKERWDMMVNKLEYRAIKDAEGRMLSGDTDSENESEEGEGESGEDKDSDIDMEDQDEELTEAEIQYHDELWRAKFPATFMAQPYRSDSEDSDNDWAGDEDLDSQKGQEDDEGESDSVGKDSGSDSDAMDVDEDASEEELFTEDELQSLVTTTVLRSGNARYKA